MEDDGTAIIAEINFTDSNDDWILDSGASEHMTFAKSSYSTYRVLDTPKPVRFGNNNQGTGIGVGDIKVLSKVGEREHIVTLKDVLHVAELRRKLVSVSAITSRGNTGKICDDKIVIHNQKGDNILQALRQGNLFRIPFEEIKSDANAAVADDDVKLWHLRFAHINKRYIESMAKKTW